MTRLSEKGFSLIEVLVGLLIMGLALGVFLETFNSALHLRERGSEYSVLPLLAQAKMETIMAGEERAEEGYFNEPWNEYRWRLWRETQADGVTLWSLRLTRRDGREAYRLSAARLDKEKS
jgi:prepilin-type N-terminal cleavage/methylation domain-containing protein